MKVVYRSVLLAVGGCRSFGLAGGEVVFL